MLGLVGDSVPKEEEEEEKKDRIFPLKRNRFARWIFIYFFIDVTRKNAERSDEKKIARKKKKKKEKRKKKKKERRSRITRVLVSLDDFRHFLREKIVTESII